MSQLFMRNTRARASSEAHREGDVPAQLLSFERVYAGHARFVFRVLSGMGVRDHQVDDAPQDVFLVVHQRLPQFDARARVTTWLFQIAIRVAQNYRRKGRRASVHLAFEDEQAAPQRSPQEQAEDREAAEHVRQLLDGLDDEKRAVWILSELEEMTAPEIAEMTGTPLNTVYTRLRRARAAFSASWTKRGGPR